MLTAILVIISIASVGVGLILASMVALHTNQELFMKTLADIQAQNAQLIQAVADSTTVEESAITLISGFQSQLTDLKTQLDAAIASGQPTDLTDLSTSLDSTITSIGEEKSKLAAAISANTPAA